MIDTHTHLYLADFKNDIDEVVHRAERENVNKLFLPAIDSSTHDQMISLEQKFPGCIAMMGLHPCSVKENYSEELELVSSWLSRRKFAAIGEIGIDLYWDRTYIIQQVETFDRQIRLALEYDLPIVIHSRNATRECIDVVSRYSNTGLTGIFHCFSGTSEEANEIIKSGFLLGIGGVVTYKNAGLADVIRNVDLEHLVLETDSPYLTPVPFRGKRNESSYLKIIAEKLAEVKQVDVRTIEEVTDANALKLFKAH